MENNTRIKHKNLSIVLDKILNNIDDLDQNENFELNIFLIHLLPQCIENLNKTHDIILSLKSPITIELLKKINGAKNAINKYKKMNSEHIN